MTTSDRDPLDRFDAALEAFRRGETPEPHQEDPTLLAAVARLRALDWAQRADPRLANRIWDELINQTGISNSPRLRAAASPAPTPLNGRAAPHP